MNPCDICIDPSCNGRKDCHCENCSMAECCPRRLGIKPTIRITRACTQACSHCVFECGPKATETMSLETARHVANFCNANNITHAEVMGGEFFLHPQWEEVLDVLGRGMNLVRLVTNGDWAGDEAIAARVVWFLDAHREYYVSISNDQWHTNKHVRKAAARLEDASIIYRVAEGQGPDGLIPLGRYRFESSFYTMFGAYCSKPDRKYNLLIDEEGEICKCSGGAWPYARVQDYLNGGFAAVFKKFNEVFYGSHMMNCRMCQNTETTAKLTQTGCTGGTRG